MLQEIVDARRTIIKERAAHPDNQTTPGGKTGRMVKTLNMIGGGEAAIPVKEWQADNATNTVRTVKQPAAGTQRTQTATPTERPSLPAPWRLGTDVARRRPNAAVYEKPVYHSRSPWQPSLEPVLAGAGYRGIRHRNGAHVASLVFGGENGQRSTGYMATWPPGGPRQIVDTLLHGETYQAMPGGMEFDFVSPAAEAVVSTQHGRVFVRECAPLDDLRASQRTAERVQLGQAAPSRVTASRNGRSDENRLYPASGGG